jgi:DNA-binding CsgD family transcriptional regulator
MWRLPPFYVLPGLVVGALAAAALDRREDLRTLVAALGPFRGQHVVGGAGVVTYLGPVELHLGALSLQLGEIQAAVDDLAAAERVAERGGATGYLAEARHHLARALLERDAPGDVARAASLADKSGRTIDALGLQALGPASVALGERIGTRPPAAVLSPREEEVASLVAQGLTNPQIAERLVISRRTAQNHVQHILTKLGFSSRSQIASWKSRS